MRAIGDLIVRWAIRMLAVRLEVFIIVIIAVRMIVPMLRSILMHLLWTRTELVWAVVTAHGHYNVLAAVENDIG